MPGTNCPQMAIYTTLRSIMEEADENEERATVMEDESSLRQNDVGSFSRVDLKDAYFEEAQSGGGDCGTLGMGQDTLTYWDGCRRCGDNWTINVKWKKPWFQFRRNTDRANCYGRIDYIIKY